MKVWIVTHSTGYDADEIIDVFATEDLAKDYIKSQKNSKHWQNRVSADSLDYCDYAVRESLGRQGSTMNWFAACSIIEGLDNCEHTDDEIIEAFQYLIDTGVVWKLQGYYGRTAGRMIELGLCHK